MRHAGARHALVRMVSVRETLEKLRDGLGLVAHSTLRMARG